MDLCEAYIRCPKASKSFARRVSVALITRAFSVTTWRARRSSSPESRSRSPSVASRSASTPPAPAPAAQRGGLPSGGGARRPDPQSLGRPFAGRPAVVVARVGEAALDAGVAHHQREAHAFQVQGDGLGPERAAVDEQGGAGLAQQRGVLVHDAALDPYVPVPGALAALGSGLLVQAGAHRG